MVDSKPGLAPCACVQDPARVLALEPVEAAEGVVEIPLGQSGEDRALGGIPALHAFGMVLGEGDHLAVGCLGPGQVEVAAEDPRPVAWPREPLMEGLAGLDLDEAATPRRRDVGVVELEQAVAGLDDQREHAFGKRGADRRQLAQRPARQGQVEEPAVVSELARVGGVLEPGSGQGGGEVPRGGRPDLLQADEVRLLARERRSLVGEILRPPGDVPADQLQTAQI